MHVHNQDRLAGIPRLGESVEIGEVQAGVPMGEPKVGAGVMMGHGFSSVFLGEIEFKSRISDLDL